VVAQRGKPQAHRLLAIPLVEQPFKAAMPAFLRAFFGAERGKQSEPRPSWSGSWEAQDRRGAQRNNDFVVHAERGGWHPHDQRTPS
jgi:hypothetical protein